MKFYLFKDCPQINALRDRGFIINNTTDDFYIVTESESLTYYATVQGNYYKRNNHHLHIFNGADFVDIPIKYVYAVLSLDV